MSRKLRLFKIKKYGAKTLKGDLYLVIDGEPDSEDYFQKFLIINYLCTDADDFTEAHTWFRASFGNWATNPMSPPNHEAVHKLWDEALHITERTAKTEIASNWASKHWHTVVVRAGPPPQNILIVLKAWLKQINDKVWTLVKEV